MLDLASYLDYERLVIKSLWEKCVMRRSTSRLIIIVDPQSLYLHYLDLRHLNAKQHFQASQLDRFAVFFLRFYDY